MGIVGIHPNYNLRDRKNGYAHVHQDGNSEQGGSFKTLLQTSLASVNELKNVRQKKKEKVSLESLMEDLDFHEENLLQKPDHQNFLQYRDQVRKITSFILKEQFSVKTIRGRQSQKYEIVQYVNQNLAVILQEILRRNPNTLMILRLMGEVRGLIIDVQG